MIAFDEALRLLQNAVSLIGTEVVPILEAHRRVLAAPVIAQVDSPPCDSSAMDGYAVRDADLPGPLEVIGDCFAGRGFDRTVAPGTAVRIFTGAPVPAGADRVVVQEEMQREANRVWLKTTAGMERYVRPQGFDFRKGDMLIEAGQRIGPRGLVTVAGADLAQVEVRCRPRMTVLATGDELAAPGQARRHRDRVPESVSYGVAAFAQEAGALVIGSRHVSDDLDTMKKAAAESVMQSDVVLVIGGASVGEKDFAKPMFEPLGLELVFSKVSIRPGKPVWFGRCGDTLVLGLPGNPTSAMVTARLFLAPLVARLTGCDALHDWMSVSLAADLPACGSRETFVRARRSADGAIPVSNQDSSAQAALAHADLLLRCHPDQPARKPGDTVEALAF